MFTRVIKWSAIVALIGMNLSRSMPTSALILQLAAVTGAVIVLTQVLFSLGLLQPKPRLSIASISDRMPGSDSL